jgi:hypothetical protein
VRSATKHKTGRDSLYLDFIRSLPCHVCDGPTHWGLLLPRCQDGPTEAAHVGRRGLSQKSPDRETIPLCAKHHRLGKDSHHKLGKKFWWHHGIDREKLIAELQAYYR